MRNQVSQLIDILPTCVEIADLDYPKVFKGNQIIPYEGVSLVPAFSDEKLQRDYLFWEHEGNRGLRMGDWKLVSKVAKLNTFTKEDDANWELYDIRNDRGEVNDLSKKYPDKVERMTKQWEKIAWDKKAKPWPWQR